MLTRDFIFDLSAADTDVYMEHVTNMLQISLRCRPMKKADDMYWMPSCHVVAAAYEKAFNVPAVHGRRFHFSSVSCFRLFDTYRVHAKNYVHSWNILRLPSGTEVLLDLFPEETCALMPIALPAPCPAYRSDSEKIERLCENLLATPESQSSVDFYAEEMATVVG